MVPVFGTCDCIDGLGFEKGDVTGDTNSDGFGDANEVLNLKFGERVEDIKDDGTRAVKDNVEGAGFEEAEQEEDKEVLRFSVCDVCDAFDAFDEPDCENGEGSDGSMDGKLGLIDVYLDGVEKTATELD
jgi:hypothetical protein